MQSLLEKQGFRCLYCDKKLTLKNARPDRHHKMRGYVRGAGHSLCIRIHNQFRSDPDALYNIVVKIRMNMKSDNIIPRKKITISNLDVIIKELGGNKAEVAKHLGISRGTLYNILKQKPEDIFS